MQDTQELIVHIYERGNLSNKLQANQTYSDIGNASGLVSLTTDQKESEWVVEFVATRNGETVIIQQIVSNRANITPPVGSNWQMMIGVGMLILFAGAFSVLNAAVGALVVAAVGGVLWFVGFLGGATSAIAIVIAMAIAGLNYAMRNTR
jgi:hypothetical protein